MDHLTSNDNEHENENVENENAENEENDENGVLSTKGEPRT